MVFNTRSDLCQHMKHHARENARLVGPCLLPSCNKQVTHFPNLSQHLLAVHHIYNKHNYVITLQRQLSEQLKTAGQSEACTCPEHEQWIIKCGAVSQLLPV